MVMLDQYNQPIMGDHPSKAYSQVNRDDAQKIIDKYKLQDKNLENKLK